MPKHHSTVEHILIHSVAILFTFSALVSAFLGYGVYQNNRDIQTDSFLIQSSKAAGSFEWRQQSWTGGTSSSTFTIPWGVNGGWTKYSSASGLTSGSGGITLGADGSFLISSVLDTSSARMDYMYFPFPNAVDTFARGSNTVSGVSSASWKNPSDCNLTKYRYIQYKVETSSGQSSGSVKEAALVIASSTIVGTVKDSSTGKTISGAAVKYSGGSTTTASLQKNNSIAGIANAGGWPGGYSFKVNYSPNKTVSVTVSKSGYNTKTKSFTLPTDTCAGGFGKTVNMNLTKSSSSSSSSSSTSTSESTSTDSGTGTAVDDSPTVSLAEFQSVKLPKVFLAKDSTTTNLAKVKDYKKIKNFTLDIPGKNKIVFKEALNLSTQKSIDLLAKLDKYVKMGTAGKIELDSKAFAALNKKATLTMEKLKHISTPEVLVGGKKDTEPVVSNAVFDKGKESLTFDVAHFTTFEAVPKLELTSPLEVTSEQNTTIVGQISDPTATVTGRFNEVDLAPINLNPETGQFTITNLSFKEGENFLTLEAKSNLGKVLPVVATIVYDPSGAAAAISPSRSNTQMAIMAVVLVGALAFLVLLGYLVYRRRKHHKGEATKTTPPTQTPKSSPPSKPSIAAPEVFHS